jgi:mono/diheme cytochrome c family protein
MTMTQLIFRSLFVAAFLAASARAQPVKTEPGLALTYTVGAASDTVSAPNAWLYVPAGQPPTPFLSAGKFTATFTGFISVDLRGDYLFKAEASGTVKVELGTNIVLEFTGDGKKASEPTKPVRLGKGNNALKVTFTSPASGDAMLRLLWSEKGSLWEPVHAGMVSRAVGNESLVQQNKLRLGRELFFEARCAKCHTTDAGAPELTMDAPSFEGIGVRRHFGWMANWILDPKAQRATATMPKLLHGPTAQADAEAIAAFLASQTGARDAGELKNDDESIESAKKLVEALHCTGCHNVPNIGDPDATKLNLTHVNAKFPPAALLAFLKNPGTHYAWTRMPKFNFKDGEAEQLAGFLSSIAPMAKQPGPPTDAAILARGKQLVQSNGCLNCHTLKLDNQFKAKPLAELAAAQWTAGCLAEAAAGKAPHYDFARAEREALQAFAATDRASLKRHVPVEFADRQARNLNCTSCHGQLDGFTRYELLGGKLKPEWMAQFIAGETKYKPRHWLAHRMPAFPKYAADFAIGLAMTHGFPPQTPAEPPLDVELAKVGQKLIGVDGGFSCISCHSVGTAKAAQVFESEGINFSYAVERIQRAYYERWTRNPLRIEPQTKMPVYFQDDGSSPLPDVLGGDTAKQLDAFWQFFRLGDKATPPAGP